MSIFDLYSKRKKREASKADVYQYEDIPDTLRVQVVHIWRSAFGNPDEYNSPVPRIFGLFHDALCREYGVFQLTKRNEGYFDNVANYMLQTDDIERVLDIIELSFKFIGEGSDKKFYSASQSPNEAIEELNYRLREHSIGFQFESGTIIRVDSKHIHAEIVKPALGFLRAKFLTGANEEYILAHKHYRHGRYKECLNECLKAFESTLKSICGKRKWIYNKTDTAKTLLSVVFQKGLVLPFMESHFTALRSTLEAGVPTIRNKLSSHGQGETPTEVPDAIAAYALHLTATNILLLVDLEKELP